MRYRIAGIVLVAGGAFLLLWRQESAPPEPSALPTPATIRQSAPVIDRAQSVSADDAGNPTASPRATPDAQSATGLRGRIVDAITRRPVKEFSVAMIRIERDDQAIKWHDPVIRKFASDTGRFTWDLAPGAWQGAVQAPGYQQFSLAEQEYIANKRTRELVMPLLRGLTLRGRVFDQSTGAGLPDARVGFYKAGAEDQGYRIPTSAQPLADGSFTLDGVPAGDIVLHVAAKGYAHREILIAVEEGTPPVDIALSAGGRIAGVVKTISGAPVTGHASLSGPTLHGGALDETGRFSYEHIPPGSYTVTAQTDAGSASLDVVLGQDESKDNLVLTIGVGRSVRGVLRGLRPEQFSETHLVLRSQSARGAFSARPDAQGTYALNGVPVGRAVISVYGAGRYLQKTIDVPADRDAVLDVVFPTGARLSGRITRGGKPAAGTAIWMQLADDRSAILYRAAASADGRYEIEGLLPGDYRLRAQDDISRLISITGDAVLNIDIPLVQLAARIIEDGGAVPIVDADVFIRGSEPVTARVYGHKQTDHFGQFTLTGIEPGEIVLIAYKPGYELFREKIAYAAPITNKTIVLRKSAGVEVRVKAGSSTSVHDIAITQVIPGNEREIYLHMPVDRDGVGHVPSALAGTSFHIGSVTGKPIFIEDWDGQSFELP